MSISQFAQDFHDQMFPEQESKLAKSDPEFIELFDNFAFDGAINQTNLELKKRFIAFLSLLLGSHSIDKFKVMVTGTYNFGVTTAEMKEIVYQGTTYLGIRRVFPF